MSVYTADDREPGDYPTDPNASFAVTPGGRFMALRDGIPSLEALTSLWAERDLLYATSPKYLQDDVIEAIRRFRMDEVNDLPVGQRGKAAMIVLAWYPPEHGQ
jgi:hypothetical protein